MWPEPPPPLKMILPRSPRNTPKARSSTTTATKRLHPSSSSSRICGSSWSMNLVDKPDPNDIFERWFNPQYLLEVQHVFGFMWQAVDPNASPPAPKDSPKIWIMSNDYAKQCSGLQGTLAYTQPFSKLRESELSSVVSRSAMGKDDCIIHFCEELMDYYLQHQWTECSQIQPRQVTERLAANLLETLLHELM